MWKLHQLFVIKYYSFLWELKTKFIVYQLQLIASVRKLHFLASHSFSCRSYILKCLPKRKQTLAIILTPLDLWNDTLFLKQEKRFSVKDFLNKCLFKFPVDLFTFLKKYLTKNEATGGILFYSVLFCIIKKHVLKNFAKLQTWVCFHCLCNVTL